MDIWTITTQTLDGHNGLAAPDTNVSFDIYEVRVIVQDWIEDNMSKEKGVGLALLLEWDGESSLDFRNGDGEGITIQFRRK